MRTIVPGVRTLVLIIILLVLTPRSFSQSITTGNGKIEVGLGIGPLFFLGDLGGNKGVGEYTWLKDVQFPLVNLSKGVYAQVYPTEWLGFRVAINQGKLEGYDHTIKGKGGDEEFRKTRNLQFQSSLLEGYLAVELNPTVFLERYDGLRGKIRPYGLIGVGVYHFNPKGQYFAPDGSSKWVPLQPLRLEGQGMAEYPDRKPYSLTQFELPMGVGFKYYIKENMFIGAEVLHRQLFTDYVDDVSTTYIDNSLFAKYLTPEQAAMANQLYFREGFTPSNPNLNRIPTDPQRGHAEQNDAFFSTIIRMGWRLNQMNPQLRQLRCPAFY
ncbi:MAG: hypothetical protein J7502_05720 [Flavisolibacter sp.]|nr:hypothetical protein [Flavisolibacter sp.]